MIVIGALAIGLSVGVLTGMFGVGGGFLITPLLSIVLGVPMPIAVGTSAVQILGSSTAALYGRHGEGQTDYKMAIVLFGGNFAGVRLGAAALSWLGSAGSMIFRGGSVPIVEFAVLCVFLPLLVGITAWLWYDTSRAKGAESPTSSLLARIRVPPYTGFPSLGDAQLSIPVMSYVGLALGFLTGLLGVGGGVIIVPTLVYLAGMHTHRAAATSLAMVWLSSLVATITHASAGHVDLLLAVPLLTGGSVGVQLGVALCRRLAGRQLRRHFAFVVLAAALIVATKLACILW